MNIKDIIKLVNEIETDLPVHTWKIDGIDVWPIIRNRLYFDLLDDPNSIKIKLGLFTSFNKIIIFIGKLILGIPQECYAKLIDRKHNDRLHRKSDVVFLTHDTDRFSKIDGYYYNVFCDPIREYLTSNGKTSLILDLAPNKEYPSPRKSKSVYIQLHIDLCNFVSLILFIFQRRKCFTNQPFLIDLLGWFTKKKIDYSFSLRNYVRNIFIIRRQANLYRKWLHNIRPKAAFLVCYYTIPGYSFLVACHELGIKTIDLQHGVQGDSNLFYTHWKNVPLKGYNTLPAIFWVWSEAEAESIREWSDKIPLGNKPVVGGNLWLNFWMNDETSLVREYDEMISKKKTNLGLFVHILFTMQPGMNTLEWLGDMIKHNPDHYYWIRLHTTMHKKINSFKNQYLSSISNYNIVEASEWPLYALLRNVDIHITEYSAATLEAEYFGIKTILLNNEGAVFFNKCIQSGSAIVLKDRNSLPQLIGSLSSMSDKRHIRTDFNVSTLLSVIN